MDTPTSEARINCFLNDVLLQVSMLLPEETFSLRDEGAIKGEGVQGHVEFGLYLHDAAIATVVECTPIAIESGEPNFAMSLWGAHTCNLNTIGITMENV